MSVSSRVPVSTANVVAASVLEHLADDLEREHPRPVRRIAAYRQAAVSLRETSLRLEDLWRRGGDLAVTRIRHVTPAIAHVIGDLIATHAVPLPPPSYNGRRGAR